MCNVVCLRGPRISSRQWMQHYGRTRIMDLTKHITLLITWLTIFIVSIPHHHQPCVHIMYIQIIMLFCGLRFPIITPLSTSFGMLVGSPIMENQILFSNHLSAMDDKVSVYCGCAWVMGLPFAWIHAAIRGIRGITVHNAIHITGFLRMIWEMARLSQCILHESQQIVRILWKSWRQSLIK